jgi:hypothetical protein
VFSDALSGTNNLAISGTGSATRIIELSGSLTFGNVPVGSTATSTLTISNTGNSSLSVTGITYPAGYSGVFSGSIPAGGSANVTVTFSPTAVQSFSGNLTVASNKTSGTNTRAVSGSGIAATRVIALSGNMNFGNVAVGTSATSTLTIGNTGNSPLVVTGITYPAGFSGAFSGTIPAGGSQNVIVTFNPSASTTYGGNLTVAANQTAGSNTLAVSGSADISRIIALSGNMAFGNVPMGTTKTAILTISNTGNAPLNVTGISYPAGFSGAFTGVIPAGGFQTVTVTFSPTLIQSYGGDLSVASDQNGGTNTLALSGSGIAATRVISVSGTITFGNVPVGSSATRVLSITNSGNSPLNVTNITYPAGMSGAFVGVIAPGGTQNVTVSFKPTIIQSVSSNITVFSNKTSGTFGRLASGSGIAATRIIGISGNMDFGNVAVGAVSTTVLTVTNTGNSPLNIGGLSYPAGFRGSVGGIINPGTSKRFSISFIPTAVQSFDGNLTFTSDATSGTTSVPLTASGM